MDNSRTISKLFLERSQFVLIGLTGRTGSGCTTSANILENPNPAFPTHHDALVHGKPFFEGLSSKRYNIVKHYAEKNWLPFYAIRVSDVLSAYLLQLNINHLTEFIYKSQRDSSVDKNTINKILKEGSFSRTLVLKNFSVFQGYVLDHNTSTRIDESRLQDFIKYLRHVRRFTHNFKKELLGISNDLYISTYQAAGISVRKIGKVHDDYSELSFEPGSVFHLPESINRIVKIIRKIKERAFIVIDAIRNPYEARFFKDRYSAFYLVSVNAPPKDRDEYLKRVHKFTVDQLNEIEKRESGEDEDDKGNKIDNIEWIGQNVKRCIEISDIHIFNPRNELDNHNVLKSQLAWYFSLMIHPGLIAPTSMERVMQIAYTAKTNSGCISRQVGAVITDENNSIKAVGWNDVAEGQYPCSLRSADGLLTEFDNVIYSDYERNNEMFREVARNKYCGIIAESKILGGRNLSYCFKKLENTKRGDGNQVHTRSLHAEENAFLQITKYGGQGILGGKLYTTASPCELCAKKAYQLGIKDVIFIDPYPGIARDHILSIGSKPPSLIQFRGAVGKAYHSLYEPVISYKDELEYFL